MLTERCVALRSLLISQSFAQVAGLFVFSLAIAVAVAAVTGRLAMPERWEYSETASNILNGHGAFYEYLGTRYYLYGAWLYPRLLAGVLWLTRGQESAMVVVQALLMAATTVTIAAIANAMFGAGKGLWAGVLTALHPGALIYVGKLHSQTLDVLLISLSFLLLLRLAANPRPRLAACAGIVAGLAALSRGTIIPFFGIYAAWFVIVWRADLGRAARMLASGAAFGFAALMIPVVDGYVRYGHLVPLRSDTGVNLWIGNHAGASGTSYTSDATPIPVMSRMAPELARQVIGHGEAAQNDVFTAEAMRFVRTEPVAFARLYASKFWYFWTRSPHLGLLYPRSWTTVYFVYYTAVAVAALAMLATFWRSPNSGTRHGAQLFVLLALSFSATQAMFYVEGRHRWQIEPLLLLFGAAAFGRLAQAIVGYRRAPGTGARIDSADPVQVI